MNQTTPTQPVNRLYKSRIFAMLYSDRKDLLDLYNAVSGKHYEDPELLEINTLENPFSLIPDFPCMSISPPTVLTCPCGICFISRICIPG